MYKENALTVVAQVNNELIRRVCNIWYSQFLIVLV